MKSRRSWTFTSSVPALDRPSQDAGRQRLLDHRRKDRDDVNSHHATVRLKPDTTVPHTVPRRPYVPVVSGFSRTAFTSSNPSGGSITIRFAAGSIAVQIAATSGISTSPSVAVDDQPAAGQRALDVPDDTDRPPVARVHPAADQIVPVERAGRQRGEPVDRHPQFQSRQRLAASFIVSTPAIPITGRSR